MRPIVNRVPNYERLTAESGSTKILNIGEYLAKLQARMWLSHALCAPGMHHTAQSKKVHDTVHLSARNGAKYSPIKKNYWQTRSGVSATLSPYSHTYCHTYYYWYSITHSLFHSRLKSFLFCKSSLAQPFLFLLQVSLYGFPRLCQSIEGMFVNSDQ